MYEIGQKVVCISKGRGNILIVDKTYIVENVYYCCEESIDVGIKQQGYNYHGCLHCAKHRKHTGKLMARSILFLPLSEHTRQEELIKELIEPLKVKV